MLYYVEKKLHIIKMLKLSIPEYVITPTAIIIEMQDTKALCLKMQYGYIPF
jgi:hypothetical protein